MLRVGIVGLDNRVPADSGTWPWIAIGRLNREIGGHCTAALIGSRQVLTAAHCLFNQSTQRWILPDELHFVAGYQRGKYAAHSKAARFTIAPGYDPNHRTELKEMARDWAIIQLAEPCFCQRWPASRLQQGGHFRLGPALLTPRLLGKSSRRPPAPAS